MEIKSLLRALKVENFEHRKFFPYDKLETLFTGEKVLELPQQHGLESHLIDETLDRVLNGGLKSFAVLAAIQDISAITRPSAFLRTCCVKVICIIVTYDSSIELAFSQSAAVQLIVFQDKNGFRQYASR